MGVATSRASIHARRTGVRMPVPDRWSVACAGAGLLIGGWLGAQRGFQLDDPATFEWFSPELAAFITAVGLCLGLGLLGLVLSMVQSARPFGLGLLTAAAFVAVGLPVGGALGPTWHPVETLVGHVRVALTAPVGEELEASATCTALPGDGRTGTIDASPLGRVGIDELHLRLEWAPDAPAGRAPAKLALGVNADPGYEGVLSVAESGHDRLTGRGTFSGVESLGTTIGGRPGAAAGEISWDCTGGVVHTPPPWASPTDETSPLEGWFHLRGIVTIEPDAPGATPPLGGRASGLCSRASELHTRGIETVVPWLDGGRARLRLVPEPTRAILTIETGDGSVPETITAPATVRLLNDAQRGHSLTAIFQLRAGRLGLSVDWWCPD
jgi:hypothetical protein